MVAAAKMSGWRKALSIYCLSLFPIFFPIQTTKTQAIRHFRKEKDLGLVNVRNDFWDCYQ